MSGIFQGDAIIKTAIELGLEDMRQNPWLISHMLEDFTTNVYLKDKYGQSQIDACKEWLLNNQIDIYLRPRDDKDRMPCVVIIPGNSPEKDEMKTMGDSSSESVILLPNQINKPIPYIVKPFTPVSYDADTGEVGVDPNLKNSEKIVAGMILVNPQTGEGFKIIDFDGDFIKIEAGIDMVATQFAVVPQFQYYTARIEHTFVQETWTIGCYAHGDVQTLLWLHSIILYSILRYRESLLEANGFTQSSVSSGTIDENLNYTGAGGEKSYVRFITLTGMAENSWIKSPKRILENTALKEKTSTGFRGGIKILSNSDPDIVDENAQNWHAVDSDDPEDQD